MTPSFGLASAFSDSHFKQPALARKFSTIRTGVIHRPRYLVGHSAAKTRVNALLGPPSLPFPHRREGAERRKALLHSLHLAVPRALRARHLPALHRWRLPPRDRLPGPDTGAEPLADPGGFRRPFIRTASSHRRQPFLVRADGNPRRPGSPVRVTQGRGRHAYSAK